MNPVNRALILAYRAHSANDQRRKYTYEPYIVHPIAVADLVEFYGGTEAQVAAALLHDVVEDTHISSEIIHLEFGETIGTMVDGLTNISKPEDGNRAERKRIDREHIAACSADTQFVKCADIIHNIQSIMDHDKEFAKTYIPEKKLLLDAMTKVHDTRIWRKASRLINNYYELDVNS